MSRYPARPAESARPAKPVRPTRPGRPAQPARLDPVGRLRLPRRSTTVRAGLVALLLLTAAGVLYSGDSGGSGSDTGAQDASTPAADHGLAGTESAGCPPEAGDPDRWPVPAGLVGVPVPLAEAAALAVLRPGDRVDLLAVPADGDPVPVADDAAVLASDRTSAAVLLAVPASAAQEVVSAPVTTRFAVVVRP